MKHLRRVCIPCSNNAFEIIRGHLRDRSVLIRFLQKDEFCIYLTGSGREKRNVLLFRIAGIIQKQEEQIVVSYSIIPTIPALVASLFILFSVIDATVSLTQGVGVLLYLCFGIAVLGVFFIMILYQTKKCISIFEKQIYDMIV